MSKKIVKAIAVMLIIVISMFCFAGCGNKKNEVADNKEYLTPLTNYFEGIKNKNLDQVLKSFPDFMHMDSKLTMDDINDMYNHYESLYGANIQIEYTFGEATQLGDEELSELEGEVRSVYNVESVDFTDGYSVQITVTVKGDGTATEDNEDGSEGNKVSDSGNTENSEMYVLQYNGNWYVM